MAHGASKTTSRVQWLKRLNNSSEKFRRHTYLAKQQLQLVPCSQMLVLSLHALLTIWKDGLLYCTTTTTARCRVLQWNWVILLFHPQRRDLAFCIHLVNCIYEYISLYQCRYHLIYLLNLPSLSAKIMLGKEWARLTNTTAIPCIFLTTSQYITASTTWNKTWNKEETIKCSMFRM